MDKLIITVTCDSDSAFPGNPNNPTPKGMETVVAEYLRGIDAGAAISHIHGPRKLDDAPQPDGSRLSTLDIPGWGRMNDAIVTQRDTIMQFGIASGRFPQRKELIRKHTPDMISVAFVAHDECFDYDPTRTPKEIYGIHSRTELEEYCTLCNELGVKVEVEAFHTGGFWNAQRMMNKGLLKDPVWITCFFGWKGGAWTPPTSDAVLYMRQHLPARPTGMPASWTPTSTGRFLPRRLPPAVMFASAWRTIRSFGRESMRSRMPSSSRKSSGSRVNSVERSPLRRRHARSSASRRNGDLAVA